MSKNELVLRPSYWACVSGGKDSLYMLNLILHNLDKYKLDGVVHYELEVDYPFVKNVIDYMESECKKIGLTFVRIKPSKTWEELYNTTNKYGNKTGYPTRKVRWCNNYKLTCYRQLKEFLKEQGCYVVSYIGYCYDEIKRYEKRKENGKTEIYPLVDFGIIENDILLWAKEQPLFNNYYLTNTRQGCMWCPLQNRMCLTYLYKYYPNEYEEMLYQIRETEAIRESELGRKFTIFNKCADELDNDIKTKWLPRLNAEEQKERFLLGL